MIGTIFGRLGILVRVVVSLAVTTWLVSFPLLAVAAVAAVIFEYTGVPFPGGNVFMGAFFAVAFLLALRIKGPLWPSDAQRVVKGSGLTKDRYGYEGAAGEAATLLDGLASGEEFSGRETLTVARVLRGGTARPDKRADVWAAVEHDPEAVFEGLFALYDEVGTDGWNGRDLTEAIERLGRDHPEALEVHVEPLLEAVASDSSWVRLHAALALCHADRATTSRLAELDNIGAAPSASGPGVLDERHEQVLNVFLAIFGGDLDAPAVELRNRSNPDALNAATVGLGYLAVHDGRAVPYLRETVSRVDQSVLEDASLPMTPADVAEDVLRHYEGVEDRRATPYPVAARLDKLDEAVARAHEREQSRSRTAGGGFEEGLDDYVCERCGATLHDVMDLDGTADGYACGQCGHVLDDQRGAELTATSSFFLEE